MKQFVDLLKEKMSYGAELLLPEIRLIEYSRSQKGPTTPINHYRIQNETQTRSAGRSSIPRLQTASFTLINSPKLRVEKEITWVKLY